MNDIEKKMMNENSGLYSKLQETIEAVTQLLGKYDSNFPTYTDHSINHTQKVYNLVANLLSEDEIANLNDDELYVLSMASYLHDIGMCIPEEKIIEIENSNEMISYRKSNPDLSTQDYIRNIHHELSYKFIMTEWELLRIPDKRYAMAIGLVAQGHRKVELSNIEVYDPKFFVKDGRNFVCLPYLAALLRMADELDITSARTPRLLTKYYMPNNERSVQEWQKHIATSQINFTEDKIIFRVDCTDQNIYAALQDQFEKIRTVMNYCQKVIRTIANTEHRRFSLGCVNIEVVYNFIGFDPKGIKYSFDVQNVVTAFIGEELYKNRLTALREIIQNSIDSCRYKKANMGNLYIPNIEIKIEKEHIIVTDNGSGMDEYIIENFFARLASSFYEQEKVKDKFEAIGQFGVGVFSYFLISEYIDIETKVENGKALKFRIDKDPKNYFYFFDKSERIDTGTTVKMYLKKDIIGLYTYEELEKYISDTFMYIEFPIKVSCDKVNTVLLCKSFKIKDNDLIDKFKIQHRKLAQNFELVHFSIVNDEFEGECSIILNKDLSKRFELNSGYFYYDHFYALPLGSDWSSISYSQKGVFVNYYSGYLLNFLLGNINIKKKIKLNIDRNEFSNEKEINAITLAFEKKIIEHVLIEANRANNIEKLDEITHAFIANYYDGGISDPSFLELLSNNFYFKTFEGSNYVIQNIKTFESKHNKFICVSDKEDVKEIFKIFGLPILIIRLDYNDFEKTVFYISSIINSPQIMVIGNGLGYWLFDKANSKDRLIRIKECIDYIKFDNYINQICDIKGHMILMNIWVGKNKIDEDFIDESFVFNVNHNFFDFIMKNEKKLKESDSDRKILSSIISKLSSMHDIKNKVIKEDIEIVNNLISHLTIIPQLPFFKEEDFFQLPQR